MAQTCDIEAPYTLLESEYLDSTCWVEAMWKYEEAASIQAIDTSQGQAAVAVSLEVYEADTPSLHAKANPFCSKSQSYDSQRDRQATSSKGARYLGKAEHFISCLHRKSYRCPFLGCNRHPFEYSKDLSRHINDIHNTTARHHCPVDTCKYSKANAGRFFKRRDNLLRHLRRIHRVQGVTPARL